MSINGNMIVIGGMGGASQIIGGFERHAALAAVTRYLLGISCGFRQVGFW